MSGIDYGTLRTKKQKVKWMKDNVSTEPSAAIIEQARTEGWLCKNKDGTGGWNDFLTDGLDALHGQLGGQGIIGDESGSAVLNEPPPRSRRQRSERRGREPPSSSSSAAAAMNLGYMEGDNSPPPSPSLSDFYGPGYDDGGKRSGDTDDEGEVNESAIFGQQPEILTPDEYSGIRGRGSNQRKTEAMSNLSIAAAPFGLVGPSGLGVVAYTDLYNNYMTARARGASSSSEGVFGQVPMGMGPGVSSSGLPVNLDDDLGGRESFAAPRQPVNQPPMSSALSRNVGESGDASNQLDQSLQALLGSVQSSVSQIRPQLDAEFERMRTSRVPGQERMAQQFVRNNVRNLLTNVCYGNYVAAFSSRATGGPPVAGVQSVGMPQLGAAGIQNIGVRPGMMRIYSPGATAILRRAGVIGQDVTVPEMDVARWQSFTAVIRGSPGLQLNFYFTRDDYMLNEAGNRVAQEVFSAIVPQNNVLFNSSVEHYDHWVQNFVDTQVRWIVERDESGAGVRENYARLVSARRENLNMPAITPEQPIDTGFSIRDRAYMWGQALVDTAIVPSNIQGEEARGGLLPIEQIMLQHVRYIQEIRDSHARLQQILNDQPNWLQNMDQTIMQRLFRQSTPAQMVTAAREIVWGHIERWHNWYAGIVAPVRNPNDTGITAQNMTFGGRWRNDDGSVVSALEMAIVEFPVVLQPILANLYLLEGAESDVRQAAANIAAIDRQQSRLGRRMDVQNQIRHTNNFFRWITTEEGKAWIDSLPTDAVERAQAIALRLAGTIDFASGQELRQSYRATAQEQARQQQIAERELPLEAVDPNQSAVNAERGQVCLEEVCSNMNSPLYPKGERVLVYPRAGQQAVARLKTLQAQSASSNEPQLRAFNPRMGTIIAIPGEEIPPDTNVSDPRNPVNLLPDQYVVSVTLEDGTTINRLMNTSELDAVAVVEIRRGEYLNPRNAPRGQVVYPNHEQAVLRRAALQHGLTFDAVSAISDYRNMSEERRQREVERMTSEVYRRYLAEAGGREDVARLNRAVQAIFRSQRINTPEGAMRGQRDLREAARALSGADRALVGQRSTRNYENTALQNVLFHAFQVYNAQFDLLQRTWNELHNLDPFNYNRTRDGIRGVPRDGDDGWDNPESPINSQNIGESRGLRNPRVRSSARQIQFVASFQNWFNSLLSRAGLDYQLGSTTRATAYRLWNGGFRMNFYDFITNFAAELMPTGRAQNVAEYDKGSSAAAVTSGPSRLVIIEAFGRPRNMSARQYRSMINSRWEQWIGNQQILEQQSRDDELRSQQLKRGRSDGGDNPRPGDKDQKLDSGNEDDGDGDGDDGDGTSEGQGGGRRRKKTRRKKSKYSKMKGGKKKTRRKRGGKNKSRKKRGGETDLTKDQCKDEFRKHKICGDGKRKQYLKFSRTNHPDRNPEDGGAAFQTLNTCLGQHWEGEMNKLNEDDFGCEAKAEMVGTQEGHNVPTKKVETKEGYKATNETHLGCRKAVTDGGQEYWYNKHHETTYNKNSEVCGGTDKELRLQNKKLDEKYEECDTAITPAGEKYYYNRNTKARTYDKDDGTCKTEQQLSVPCNSKKDCQEGQICYGEKGAKVCGTVEDAKAAGKAKGEKRRAEAAEAAAAAQDVDLSSLPKSEEEKATQQETVAPQTGDIDPVQKEEEPAINPQQATDSQQTGDITPVQKEEEPAINPQQGEEISKEQLEKTINELSPELKESLKETQAKFKDMSQEQIQEAFNKTTEDLFKNLGGHKGGRKKRKKAKRKTKRKTKRKKSKKKKRRTRRRR